MAVLTIGLLIIIFFLTPSPAGIGTHQQIIPVPCLFYILLERPCPSCGFTTSLAFLTHGEIAGSFNAHPLGFIVFLSIIGTAMFSIIGFIRNWAWWNIIQKRWFQNLILCGIGIYIGVWIVRLLLM